VTADTLNLTNTANTSFTGASFALSNTAAARTVTFSTAAGSNTTISGCITNGGTGAGGVTLSGSGVLAITGSGNYTGVTTINGGTLAASTLASGGSNSSIGAATNNAANLILNGGTLQYTGAGGSQLHLFTLGAGGGTLDASGTGNIAWANASAVVFAGANTSPILTLTGSNAGNNSLAPILGNNGSRVPPRW